MKKAPKASLAVALSLGSLPLLSGAQPTPPSRPNSAGPRFMPGANSNSAQPGVPAGSQAPGQAIFTPPPPAAKPSAPIAGGSASAPSTAAAPAPSASAPSSMPPPARPSANAVSNNLPGVPASKPLPEESYGEKLKLGDYVELDDSIKNEMYGTIDFPNADLKDIVKAIAKLSGKNFILDNKVQGQKVTIVSPQAVTKQEAYNAFLSALYMNDLTIVSLGKFLKIVNAKDALQNNIRVFVGDYAPASEEVVTVLYPLRHLNAEDIQRFIIDLVPRSGRITNYPNTNTLVLTDTGINIRRIIAILKSVDVPGHEDQLETIPIRYATAKGIAALLDDILEAMTGRRASGPGAARGQPQKTRGGGTITKIVSDERTNSLIVLANGRGVQELRSLVEKLDSPNAAGGGNIHIYYCKNAVAEELATTINSLISGQQANRNQAPGAYVPPPGAPGFMPIGGANRGDSGVRLEGNLKVTADKATNSLVIVGSGSDFSALKSVLKRLDIPRRQVYVQATIMELSTDESKSLGVAVNVAQPGVGQAAGFIPANGGANGTDALKAINSPAALTGVVSAFGFGNGWEFVLPGGERRRIATVTGLIRALVDSKQGQILHEPQILTSDNQDAEIIVKESIAYKASSTTINSGTASAAVQDTFQKEPVTISLKIKPQIGQDNNLIKLKVEQVVDSFANSKYEGQIDTTNRKATTEVVVRDGNTVVVGGLQKTSYDDLRSKIPLLGDLPVVGWLFKGSSGQTKRTNLVLFLTPRVINEYGDLLKLTGEKIEKRIEVGKKLDDPKDRIKEELKTMREQNAREYAQNPASFRPKSGEIHDDSDDEMPIESPEKEGAKANAQPETPHPADAAYIDPAAVGMGQPKSTYTSQPGNANTILLNQSPPPALTNATPGATTTLEGYNSSMGNGGASPVVPPPAVR